MKKNTEFTLDFFSSSKKITLPKRLSKIQPAVLSSSRHLAPVLDLKFKARKNLCQFDCLDPNFRFTEDKSQKSQQVLLPSIRPKIHIRQHRNSKESFRSTTINSVVPKQQQKKTLSLDITFSNDIFTPTPNIEKSIFK